MRAWPLLALLLAAGGTQQATQPKYEARDYGIAYIVTAPTTVRASASVATKEVGTLRRFDLPRVIEAKTGWAHVLVVPPEGSGGSDYDGWIQVPTTDAKDHLADVLDAALRIVKVKKQTWTTSVQDDVVMGRVRPGFTKEQTRVAHVTIQNMGGEPLSITTNETAAGVREEWLYPRQVVRFADAKVVEIANKEK